MDSASLTTASVALWKNQFRRAIGTWYRKHGRDLPWRRTRDPYAILVSEFMLQQTQVVTVLPYFKKWLRRFPNFTALARASERDVLHAWQGLGYYSRARNLHAAAKTISANYGGHCPSSVYELRELPGIGRYTANAVATFAFDQPVPAVDANIARVIARLFNISTSIDSAAGRNRIWECASRLIRRPDPGRFNSALMDLGALVCLPRAPQCGLCPVKEFCRAKDPYALPAKRARPQTKELNERHAFKTQGRRLLMQQSTRRWRGMWILPSLTSAPKKKRPIHKSIFPFTNHRVTLEVFAARARKLDNQAQRWIEIRALNAIPIPSPHRRAIDALISTKMSAI